ncbi:MAG: formate--tetrahydrofolate ligase [Actinobacteria bacterium]|nr:formate--tetrahydrofolate ligase [Actinomycetota bacterium]MCG2795422.1 formate--tetrahydrofolate ligase [Actinomycetes bacterium]
MAAVPSDIEIAQAAKMKPITEIAKEIGLEEDELELYGKYKAKVRLDVVDRIKDNPTAKYIDVTAITPTPLGEGKTVTSIGLTEALNKIGKDAIICIREPSMGPVFGIKGGAAGGGYSQVVPMEDLNLHFTGDIHAIGAANNLLAAYIDTSVLLKNPLDIDPMTISWRRVVDISDRALRDIVVGLGGKANGYPRQTGFDITVASEVMAILALADGLEDLKERLNRIVVAYTYEGEPVTAKDLKCAGAMAALLKDAINPNLIQTLEGNACFMHAGPFANIAQGNSSVVADIIATKLADYVVTESGFGADCGAEKMMNIKVRAMEKYGIRPDCVVITATIRALKMHGGAFPAIPGRPIPEDVQAKENYGALESGSANLIKHIENMKLFGIPVVVTINRRTSDRDKEVEMVHDIALEAGADFCEPIDVWAKGGEGGTAAAEALVKACEMPSDFHYLYSDDDSIKEKIEKVATRIYGADGVDYSPAAEASMERLNEGGFDKLPLCMAKTHLSLSHDPTKKGRPTGWRLPIRDIRPSVGAGFIFPLCGDMKTMPGLPSTPAGNAVDVEPDGRIVGLF